MQNRKVASVKKQSIAEKVADEIRDNIISGRILPGERLKEKELCEELNVSPTPLREAFRILQTQNLIEYNPYVGVSVVELTRKHIEDVWDTKALLEPEAAARAAGRISDRGLGALRASLKELSAVDGRSMLEFAQIDYRFHHIIAEESGNSELAKMIDGIYNKTILSRIRSVDRSRSVKQSYLEHQKIVSALEARNAEEARRAAEEHLRTSLKAILEGYDLENGGG